MSFIGGTGATSRTSKGRKARISSRADLDYDGLQASGGNGVGFDPARQGLDDGKTHVGIENVRSRLAAMCGETIEIQSEPGVGTTAVMTIPKNV
jgi:signal transduction histidine kinase